MKDGNGALSEWSVPLNFKLLFIPVDSAAIYPTGEIIETLPLFDWSDAYFPYPEYKPESITYQLQISYSESFDNIILNVEDIMESQYQVETEFSIDTEYYYRIRYFDENNVSSDWAWTVFRIRQ